MSIRRTAGLRVVNSSATEEVTLVDATASEPEVAQELMTHEEANELERQRRAASSNRAVSLAHLTISDASLTLARRARETLEAQSDGDPAERILEDLVAGEVGLGHELQNLEGMATALLARTMDNPALAMHVAKVAREVFGLSTAVRRRTENSLSAIAGLRAQRVLLAAPRGGLRG